MLGALQGLIFFSWLLISIASPVIALVLIKKYVTTRSKIYIFGTLFCILIFTTFVLIMQELWPAIMGI